MPKLIYVADDEKNICFLIENFLEKEGYEVECFGDGESLLDAFQKKAPDLCILDIKRNQDKPCYRPPDRAL